MSDRWMSVAVDDVFKLHGTTLVVCVVEDERLFVVAADDGPLSATHGAGVPFPLHRSCFHPSSLIKRTG